MVFMLRHGIRRVLLDAIDRFAVVLFARSRRAPGGVRGSRWRGGLSASGRR